MILFAIYLTAMTVVALLAMPLATVGFGHFSSGAS